MAMNFRFAPRVHDQRTRRLQPTRQSRFGCVAAGVTVLVTTLVPEAGAQSTAGPYSNYNWNSYPGPIYYNQGYAQYGLPGVGLSPWDPIVQSQLNLGMRTARYNMYSAWADQANAAANLYYQQAEAQALENQRHAEAVHARYDVRTRVPKPAAATDSSAAKLLAKHDVLRDDGEVVWPKNLPSSTTLDVSKAAAEAAIRVAVKEFTAEGHASVQSVAEAKSQLFAFGKPALEQLARANREEAKKLLKFLASLEQVLDSLAGE
jgi:hypothetical protein